MTKAMMAAKAASPANQRRAQRDLVNFGAHASSRSGIHDVHIVNVSPLGLMGRVRTPLAAGDKLLFDLPHVRNVESVVRWVEDGRIGVEFVNAIAPDRYSAMLAFMPQRQMNW